MTAHLYIDGRWTSGSGTRRGLVFDPALGIATGEVAYAEKADLEEALFSSARAFPKWRSTSPFERYNLIRKAAGLLRERAEQVARRITAEQGKPLPEARAEVAMAADHMDWNAEEGRRAYGRIIPSRGPDIAQLVILEPVGPVAGFSPWNFPVTQLVRKIAAALAAGCTIIAKAPEETPGPAIELVRCFEDAGVPPGVINLVFGVPSEISECLVASDIIRKVSFTGSIPVGRALGQLAARHMKRTTMELGGHAPLIVLADADPDRVALLAAAMKFRNAGQVCASPTRLYVEEPIFERFVDSFVARARTVVVGPGIDERTQMGPLAHKRRLDAMEAFVQDARDRGASVLVGGQRLGKEGYFYQPTVLTHVPKDAEIMLNEPFGPVAIINPVASLDEAISEANSLPYGLSAYGFTGSLESADRMTAEVATGTLSINHFGLALPETPFGGIRDSGHGSEGGIEGLQAYLQPKFVSRKRS